jgi:thiamine-phosphate pyrophosphorylase
MPPPMINTSATGEALLDIAVMLARQVSDLPAMSATSPGTDRRGRLAAARLYLVCDSRPGGRSLGQILPAAVAGGVQIVQLREKRATDSELTRLACAARELCDRLGVLLIVNDRPAVAFQAGADGLHLGQADMPVEEAREVIGPDMLIGLSTHSRAQVDAAAASDIDYIGVGPVHETPTKPGRAAVGVELVRYASSRAQMPFFAIGGITQSNLAAVIAAGARRVAVVRAIAQAEDPERAARSLTAELERHLLGLERDANAR